MRGNRTKILKTGIFLVLAGAAAYALLFTPQGQALLSAEGRRETVARIDLLVRTAGPLGPPLFVLLYALGVLALPVTPFNAAGAVIFGKYLGSACSILGASLGASLSFVMGRYFLRDFARDLLTGKLGDLDRKAERHGFSLIFYLRIVWFPFLLLNYGAGATRIRFRDFFWGTFLGTMPAILVVCLLFGSLKEIAASYRGPADLLRFDVLLPAGLLGFSFFLPGLLRRFRGERAPEDASADGA